MDFAGPQFVVPVRPLPVRLVILLCRSDPSSSWHVCLAPADFGIVTMVTTFSLLLRSFGLNGFSELIMQREEITESLASNFFWVNLGIGAMLTLTFAGSGPLLALFYHNSAVIQVTRGMSLTIVIGCLGYVHWACCSVPCISGLPRSSTSTGQVPQ